MLVDDLMRRLYADLQTEGEREGEAYLLHLEGDLKLTVSEKGGQIYLQATPGPLPPADSHEQLFLTLLLANLFGQGTGGATLGLDASGKEVLFSRKLPQNTSYAEFREELETFLNYLAYWIQTLPFPPAV